MMSADSTVEGWMRPGKQKTASKLKAFEPMILPIAKSGSFLSTLATEAASSGKLVPMATMVKPITKSLMPNATAILTAAQTSSFELAISPIKPARKNKKAFKLGRSAGISSLNSSSSASQCWGELCRALRSNQYIKASSPDSRMRPSIRDKSPSMTSK